MTPAWPLSVLTLDYAQVMAALALLLWVPMLVRWAWRGLVQEWRELRADVVLNGPLLFPYWPLGREPVRLREVPPHSFPPRHANCRCGRRGAGP